jgi:hypothetical protein
MRLARAVRCACATGDVMLPLTALHSHKTLLDARTNMAPSLRGNLTSWSLSWANTSRLLWNQKFHYRVHNSPPPVHTVCSFKFNFNVHLPSNLLSSKWYFPSGLQITILFAFLIFTMRATCPAYLILLDLTTHIISDEQYKLHDFPFGSFLVCSAFTFRF